MRRCDATAGAAPDPGSAPPRVRGRGRDRFGVPRSCRDADPPRVRGQRHRGGRAARPRGCRLARLRRRQIGRGLGERRLARASARAHRRQPCTHDRALARTARSGGAAAR